MDPSQVHLRAEPLGSRSPDGRRTSPGPEATARNARLTRTRDPHLYRFSVQGLHRATLYRLGISFPPNLCGKVFWRGPFEGLAVSGGAPVEIEGFAARTEVEISDLATGQWVGTSDLQFTDPDAAVREFRWRSSLPGVIAGELQVSTEPFPHLGTFGACDEPSRGVIYRRQVPAIRGGWVSINSVDFGHILGNGRTPPS